VPWQRPDHHPISVGGSHPSRGGGPGERLTGRPGDTPPVDRGPVDYDDDGTAANTLFSGSPERTGPGSGTECRGPRRSERSRPAVADTIALLRTANAEVLQLDTGR
jgi:hypothetical protein